MYDIKKQKGDERLGEKATKKGDERLGEKVTKGFVLVDALKLYIFNTRSFGFLL